MPAGAVPVGRRSNSLNSFSPEAFMFPVDVEKVNISFFFFFTTTSVNPLDSGLFFLSGGSLTQMVSNFYWKLFFFF